MIDSTWLTTSAGVKMPPIIYGTAWKKERTADLVVRAIQTGFRGIDTAGQPRHYDEAQVGAALQSVSSQGIARKDLFVQTKFTPIDGQDPHKVPYDRHSPIAEQVAQSFETSQNNLQTDYVDSFVLHSPVAPYSRMMTVWRAMQQIYESGGARQLGISNCYQLELLQALTNDAEIKPAVVQNRFYRDTGYDADLRRWCADHGIIYQSFWTLTANPHILASDIVQTIARNYNQTEAQIFFRYLSQSGIVPLTGTCSEQHMREDLSIFAFELADEELARIHGLLA